MGFISDIFGGGDQQITQTTSNAPWAGVQPGFNEAYKRYSELFKAGGPQYYPGQTYVSPDPLQNYAQNLSLAYATQSLPQQFGQTQSALSQMLNAPNVAQNPYISGVADVVQNRLGRQFRENINPAIRSGAVAAGQLGGSRQALAQGLAARGTQEATGDALAQLYADAYSQGLGQQRAGVGYSPAIMQAGMMPFQIMGDVGAYRRGTAQEALQADIDRYQFGQERPYAAADRYLAALSMTPWNQSSAQTQPGQSNLASGIGGALLGSQAVPALASALAPAGMTLGSWAVPGLSGLGAIGGGLLGLLSDRRLKKNIKPIGKRGDHEWYEFEFIDPDYGIGKQTGVMADEVEKINPDAVYVMPNGYKAVNYGAL